jgi:hypothetical protein
MSDFRYSFLLEYFKTLEQNTIKVKPQEMGILRERYQKIYSQTPRHLRPRVFEQLLCSVQLFAAQSEELYKEDNLAFAAFLLKLSKSLNEIIEEYHSSFEIYSIN